MEMAAHILSDLFSHFTFWFSAFFTIVWLLSFTIHLIAVVYGRWRLYRCKPALHSKADFPGVSIIKPLVGADDNLAINLETFFNIKYPKYELLFCLPDEADPAYLLIQMLIDRYPAVIARVFISDKSVGINPKINNMMPAYEAAEYDLVMVSDAALQMKEDTLTDMVNTMVDEVALVHQIPFVCNSAGFPAVVEKVYFGTAHARIYLVADFIGANVCNGMSSVMRKKVLDEVGGLATFGQYIAEDYFIAKSMLDRGWKASICAEPAWQNSPAKPLKYFQKRMTRWIKLRATMYPPILILEPMSECLLQGLVCSLSFSHLSGYNPLFLYLLHILVWILCDYLLLCTLQNDQLPFSKLDFLLAWLYRELSTYVFFIRAVCDRTVKWRSGSKFRLKWGGFAEECDATK